MEHAQKAVTGRLKKQYENADNFNKRVELVSRFSVNPRGFTRWIFDHIALSPASKVLELGCGPGYLWYANLERLPAGVTVVLTDFSEGMVEAARNGLSQFSAAFEYQVADAQQIPFEDGTFGTVIANHMLYHVPDRQKALSEIHRVLKPGGVLYASTIGKNNLRELRENFRVCFSLPDTQSVTVADAFGLENGATQLSEHFHDVGLDLYDDHLEVTEAQPMLDYLLSSKAPLLTAFMTPERRQHFTEHLNAQIQRDGHIRLTRSSGLFIAKKAAYH